MAKMWQGLTDAQTAKLADDFNSSIAVDKRMYAQDIKGSIAHARMLAKQGIITPDDADALTAGLKGILEDLDAGRLQIDMTAEDIHMFVEQVLTERVGDVGKKLHTARSRNDQVALDTRMYLRDVTDSLVSAIKALIGAICDRAQENTDSVMPGYTHLQRAQPVSFAHQIMAYAMMLLRDIDRFSDCRKRINISPIGACALAGTTYPTDREFEAAALGFDGVTANSIDSVSDRDFCVEFISCCAMTMMHLSRFAEEMILWSTKEFGFVTLPEAYTTGSSIMPQKKNPDMAELVRGKTGRVYGDLVAMLTVLKGLPLAYNKDMQEDKENVFDAADTLKMCVDVMTPMVAQMTVHADTMKRAAQEGFINATDIADWLVGKGMPFRAAYKVAGQVVAKCTSLGVVAEELAMSEYKAICELFDEDLYKEIDITACMQKRTSQGGTAKASVDAQIAAVRKAL